MSDKKYTSSDGSSVVTTVSPYQNTKLKYTSADNDEVAVEKQLRLACLEASVTFYEDKPDDDPEAVLETARKFWEFVKLED